MKKKNSNDITKKKSIIQKQDSAQKEEKLMNEIVDLKNAVNINWKILNENIITNLDSTKDSNSPEEEKHREEIEELLNS